jgi:hypothetical protein
MQTVTTIDSALYLAQPSPATLSRRTGQSEQYRRPIILVVSSQSNGLASVLE